MYTIGLICDKTIEIDVPNMNSPIVFSEFNTPVTVQGYYVIDNGKRTEYLLNNPLKYCAGSIPFIYCGKLFRGIATAANVQLDLHKNVIST